MPHRRGGRFGKKIETVHWTVGTDFQAVGVTTGSTAGVTVLAAQHLPETLMRMRGESVGQLATAAASGTGARIFQGLILVPEGTGTTVLWSPQSDGDAPWIWWDVMNLAYAEQVTDVVWGTAASAARRVIDSKAMRKVRNAELQWITEVLPVTGLTFGTVDVLGSVRVLSGS